jgi:hypothetical protein
MDQQGEKAFPSTALTSQGSANYQPPRVTFLRHGATRASCNLGYTMQEEGSLVHSWFNSIAMAQPSALCSQLNDGTLP